MAKTRRRSKAVAVTLKGAALIEVCELLSVSPFSPSLATEIVAGVKALQASLEAAHDAELRKMRGPAWVPHRQKNKR